jgi:hypothetical protein
MNSLRMSFWMVPASCSGLTPCSSAATRYRASTGSTAPFMVIDTLILSSGMPSKRARMSRRLSMATPAMPTSAATRGWSES